jgi:hypothetical protein
MRRVWTAALASMVVSILLVPNTANADRKTIPAIEAVTNQTGTATFDNVRHTATVQAAGSSKPFVLRLALNYSDTTGRTVLACPSAGDYGYSANQWTNAYNQTLYAKFYVGFNGNCSPGGERLRFRMNLSCGGNVRYPWCNFDSDNAAFWERHCFATLYCDTWSVRGHKNFNSVLKTTNAWFTGTWHTNYQGHAFLSSDNKFYVHFLNPDHMGVYHAGCSWVVSFDSNHDQIYQAPAGRPCPYYSP